MRKKSWTSSPRPACGATLVEAVVGTGLLGTLLVAILVSNARLTAQAGRAQRRIEACRIADELLEKWWPQRDRLPRDEGGRVSRRKGWTWRTRRVENEAAEAMDAQVIALEVFGPNDRLEAPATRVEILLPRRDYEIGQGADID